MAYEIFAAGINQILWTDPGKKEPKVGPIMLRHIIEKWHEPSFDVRYRLLLADTAAGRYAAECTITANTPKPFTATRVGEVTPEERSTHPVEEAYDRAFLRAAEDLLKLTVRKVDAVQEVQELPDDEILLFGNMKGKKFGDVKNTEAFAHFLEQIRTTGELSFAEPEKTEQYRKLLRTGG